MRFRLFACAVVAVSLSGCFGSSVIDDPTSTCAVSILPALELAPYDSLGGAKLSFQRFGTTAGCFRGIYLIDGTARRVQNLLGGRAVDRALQNPTTGQLVYGAQTQSGSSIFDVYTTRITDSIETRLTSGVEVEQFPSWSADGTKVYYLYRGNGRSVVVRQNPTAGSIRDTLLLPDSQSFTWNADAPVSVNAADRLLLVTSSSGWRIWAMNFNGGNRVMLRSDTRSGIGPIFQGATWSPDASKIAFLELAYDAADQLTATTLKTMNPDGTGEASIVTIPTLPLTIQPNSLSDFSVCWLSQTRIAFTALGNDRASHVYIARTSPAVTLTQVTFNSGVYDRGVSCRP